MKKTLLITLISFAMLLWAAVPALADEETVGTDSPVAEEEYSREDDISEDEEEETEDEEEYGDEEEEVGIEEAVLSYTYTGNWIYTLIHEAVVRNTGRGVAFQIRVTVPLMDTEQPVYVQLGQEVISPEDAEISTDAYGHRTATYIIPYLYAGQSITLSQRYVMQVASLSYDFDRTKVRDDYSGSELRQLGSYLLPAQDIASADPQIIDFTRSAIGSNTDPYLKARALFQAVNRHLNYEDIHADQGALAVLNRGTASCQGYANLLIACLRAAGIAARQQSGYLYLPAEHTTAEYVDTVNGRVRLNSLAHTWVEFYLPGLGWLAADPTFTYTFENNGMIQKFTDWGYFANIDSQRRYLFFRSGSMAQDMISYTATSSGSQDVQVNFNAYLMTGAHTTAFTDIDGHWAQAAVTFCVENNLFNGVSVNRFAPESSMTRAMFVTVIGRLWEQLRDETIAPATSTMFRDTKMGAYYAPYLQWAVENGLISGYGNGYFGPDDTVTREQMAHIISLFAQKCGFNVAAYAGSIPNFSDTSAISPWAFTGIVWCHRHSIISGMPGNRFSPAQPATRAQVATIIQRLAGLFVQ